MSGKLSKNRKRPTTTSSLKMKRLKLSDCESNKDISEDGTSNEKMTVKKLVTLSQPTLRSDLKIKLHSLLSSWKPPLKNTPNENHEDLVTTDSTQESEMKLFQCDDTVSESKQLQTISTNSTKLITQAESSLNDDKCDVNDNLERKSVDPHQETSNSHDPSTSSYQVSESSTDETSKAVDFKEQITNDSLMHHSQESDVIMKDNNCDTKSLKDSPNEEENPCHKARAGFSTPEVTRTPPTPPTLKVSWLNSNGYNSPCNSICNEDSKEISNLIAESLNEPNTCNDEKLVLETSTNDELVTTAKELELETLMDHTVDNAFQSECELDVNVLHSQLNSIEQNLSTSVIQSDLDQEPNRPREVTQEHHNIDFTPFNPTSLVPEMPKISWVRQLRDDKRNLQTIVREISQLNAMLTRAVRELWSERN